jgi:sterol desaturase/sphingolipid hydroxylase (fatty acid hydroxylase superfamily)
MNYQALAGWIVAISFLLVYISEFAGGRLQVSPRPKRDFAFTLVGILSHATISGALVGSVAGLLARQFWPEDAGALATTAFWLAYPVLFVSNEFMHYWLHRYAHEWRWLWKIHRTHHSAQHLNTGVLYRYNVFWVMMLPHTWTGAVAVYFGLGGPFLAAILTTFFVNLATHTSYRWDLYLRAKMPWSEPAWKVLERVVTLPDAHHAHHAYGREAHPNGNYAISIFLFDVLFGTARTPNCRQTQFGLPISPRLHWAEELLWPVVSKPLLPKPVKVDQGCSGTAD